MNKALYLLILAVLLMFFIDLVLSVTPTVHASTEGAYRFVAKWGPPDLTRDGNVKNPQGIAVDAVGMVYVADTGNHRIQKFTSDGNFILKWGLPGSGNGQLNAPGGVAIDSAGNVYVADTSNHRVQKFTSAGVFILTWGSQGAGEGQFSYPGGVAVDSAGNVYVADTRNSRIQKFTSSGTFIASWGSQGSGNGQFLWPCGVAIDSAGNVYVADTSNHRVQKFTPSGTFVAKWGQYSRWVPMRGEFQYTQGIAVDASGYVYVTDHGNVAVQKFGSSGTYIAEWYGEGDAHLQGPFGIAIDGAGNVYVADQHASAIQKYTTSGGSRARWGNQITQGQLGIPVGIAVDSAGNVLIHDAYHFGIDKFSSTGSFIARWGSWGLGVGLGGGRFEIPTGVAIDGRGYVYAVDSWNDTVQKFTSSGSFVGVWGSLGAGNSQFDYPVDIAADADGNVYVADSRNVCIKKFTSSGTFITKWGSRGTGDGQFDYSPNAIAVDLSGNVYVGEGPLIQKFTSSGIFLAKWGSHGTGDGQLACVSGIATDTLGHVYVTDACNNRVLKYTSSGGFITQWGAPGVGDGYFSQNGPNNIAVDAEGNVYVTDSSAWTVQKFAPSTPLVSSTPLYFPHVATTSGWQTEIAIINTGSRSVSGTLNGFSNQGQLVETMPVALPVFGRREINVASEFAHHADIGYIVYEADSSTIQGYTKFYIAGAYRAATPAVKEINRGNIYVAHIDSGTQWWTGLSLVNTTAATKNLVITFNNDLTRMVTLSANEHRSFTIGSLFNDQPQPNLRSAVITNASGIIGLELFGTNDGKLLEGILLTDRTASTLFYPHVETNGWWTGIVAYNPSASSTVLTITPYTAQGFALNSRSVSIAGKGKFAGTVTTLGLHSQTAWFRIDSTQPLVGFELFGSTDGNQLAPFAGNGSTGSHSGVFAKIEKSGWTGIAFVNTESSPASVTLTAYNNYGSVVATSALTVNGHAKEVKAAEAIFSQDVSSATYIAYSADRNVVGFQLNGSADWMTLDGLPAL